MTITTGTTDAPSIRADARSRLLAELAAGPARKGYGIAYDLLGNRAEAEEAVQDALARACSNVARRAGRWRSPERTASACSPSNSCCPSAWWSMPASESPS